jgi:hypothetical protein
MIKGTAGEKRKRLQRVVAAMKKSAKPKFKFMKVAEGAKVTPDGSSSKSKVFVVPEADVPGSSGNDDFVTGLCTCVCIMCLRHPVCRASLDSSL